MILLADIIYAYLLGKSDLDNTWMKYPGAQFTPVCQVSILQAIAL